MAKTILKKTAQFIALVCMLPLYAIYSLLRLAPSGNQSFYGVSQLLSLIPGKTGSYLRVGFYRLAMKTCSGDVFVGFGTLFAQSDTELLEGVYIGPQCNIGACRIEENCLLGSAVHVMSGKAQHHFSDLETPIRDQGGILQPITIGQDCWIGNGALIMANIGKKCIIGAGAVVIGDIPDYSIVAGNPAKIIKSRLPQGVVSN